MGRDASARDVQSRDLPTADAFYPPGRYEQVKAETSTYISADPRLGWSSRNSNKALPIISRPVVGQAMAGVGGIAVQGQLFPPVRSHTEPTPQNIQRAVSRARGSQTKRGKLMISNPVLSDTSDQNPLNKIATVDLATAARNEKDRRDNVPQAMFSNLVATRAAPQAPIMSPEEMMKRSISMKRKDVGGALSSHALKSSSLEPIQEPRTLGVSSSAQLSPGVEEIRRRSPRQPSQSFQQQGSPRDQASKTPRPLNLQSATPPKRPVRPQTLQLPTTPPKIMAMLLPPPRSPKRPPPPSPPKYKPASPPQLPPVDTSSSQRSSTAGSSRRDRSATKIFTDPGAPPAIPPVHTGRRKPNQSSQIRTVAREREVFKAAPPKPPAKDLPLNNAFPTGLGPSKPRAERPLKEVVPADVKSPAEELSTNGLPTNPQAQAALLLAQEQGLSQEQTVMFMKSIEYKYPDAVRMIMESATDKLPQHPELAGADRGSIVNRPRPIPRNPSADRNIFPAEGSPHRHMRSYSAGSIKSKKSILQSTAGSPTQLPPLPPLPPLPKSAGNPLRPLPNDTRSMTFDEKMDIFFPMLSDAESQGSRRRSSSVPELPALPAEYQAMQESTRSESSSQNAEKQAEKSNRSSVRTGSILNLSDAQSQRSQTSRPPISRNTSKFSVDTAQSPVDESYLSVTHVSLEGSKRRSSPVLPVVASKSPSISSEARTRDDETTNWGSVHSPVKAVNLQRARAVEVPSMPKSGKEVVDEDAGSTHAAEFGQEETMTVMLDQSSEHDVDSHRGSQDGYVSGESDEPKRRSWHRRVGDPCPTFSTREKMGSRKMPPPTPLMLNKSPRAVRIIEAEPSPLESPQHALDIIHAQLKRFDEANRESTGSEGQRMTLLANLEMEMGMQEDHWQQMRHDLARDSLSTVKTSPNRDSHHESGTPHSRARSGEFSLKSIIAERRASRQDRLRSRSSSSSTKSSRSSQDSTHSTANQWKQTLEEAQAEYMDHKSDLVAKATNSMSLLTVTTSLSNTQLGSPTPPDTDESGSDSDFEMQSPTVKPKEAAASLSALWRPISPVADIPSGGVTPLWTPTAIGSVQTPELAISPAMPSRASTKKFEEPVMIESSQLWEDSRDANKARSPNDLWRAVSPPAPEPQLQEKAARPLTQKPPRRNRRVTALPDILENPEPLPDKRGTLGIFRFPWGEKSDTGTAKPRPQVLMAMPGTMTSGSSSMNPVLSNVTGIFDAQEYSSSFFDDYDEEDEGDNFSEYEDGSGDDDEDEDDSFDETTLWEIASLLKSNRVPSRDSLFPEHIATNAESSALIERYMDEMPSDEDYDEGQEPEQDSIPMILDMESFPSSSPPATLWADQDSASEPKETMGLAPADEKIWNCYLSLVCEETRAPLRRTRPAPISSTSLWSHTPRNMTSSNALWTPALAENAIAEPHKLLANEQTQSRAAMLWFPTMPVAESPRGLPQPDLQSWNALLPQENDSVRAKARMATPEPVESTSLWSSAPASPACQEGLLWGPPKPQTHNYLTLWTPANVSSASSRMCVPQPDAQTWKSYLPDSTWGLRAKARRSTTPAALQSFDLWSPVTQEMFLSSNRLWNAQKSTSLIEPVSENTLASGPGMWVAPTVARVEEPQGLFNLHHQRPDYRRSDKEPAALNMVRKKRTEWKPIARLVSTSLWSLPPRTPDTTDWIAIASIRPGSPTVTASSSGTASPTTDASSIRSDMTKASAVANLFADLSARFRPTWSETGPQQSIPSRTARRPATKAEWAAALNSAIEASQPLLQEAESGGEDAAASTLVDVSSASQKLASIQLWARPLAVAVAPEPVQSVTTWQRPRGSALPDPNMFEHNTQQSRPSGQSRKEHSATVDFRAESLWSASEAVAGEGAAEQSEGWLRRLGAA